MLSTKELKRELKKKTDAEPEKYYPISVFKELGLTRKHCIKCGNYFWSNTEENVCGEPECSGGYKFINNPPTKKRLDFVQVWLEFSNLFSKLGYTPIKRYPTAARWRADTDFVQASIYDFQPHVVSGEIEPPANPLVVPQYCVRFNSIESVGITGRHNTGFVMIGQHAFFPKEKFNQSKYFLDLYTWFTEGLKIPKNEIKLHESQWAGGGNMGPSIEFFSRGLELGNQVYMQYSVDESGIKDLKINVLDMGMAQDRSSWITQGNSNSYEVSYPTVCEKLYKIAGLKPSKDYENFIPYGSVLDIDSNINVNESWRTIAKKMNMDVNELRNNILPLAALYAIADHTQTLLVTLSDGVLPSNVKGGYNLRTLFRRSIDFIEKYGWNINMEDVCKWHAEYLKPQYPELMDNLDEISKILQVEKEKYQATKKSSLKIIEKVLKDEITESKLIELYDSNGITPELVQKEAENIGKIVTIPADFYSKINALHEEKEKQMGKIMSKEKPKIDVSGLPETKKLYYEDESLYEFSAKVLKVDGEKIILDRTAFYPRGGGAEPDHGTINEFRVYDVEKIGNVIVHHVEKHNFKLGETVKGKIDKERREAIKIHHTAVHVINLAAREILGNHVWQAGSYKDAEKARLDITHYESPSEETLAEIEKTANKIVKDNVKVKKEILQRDEAEKKYGFRLYQGGAVPGKILRIVSVGDDHEACGGIHVDSTKELGLIKILKVEKIQDGVVRLELAAGNAVEKHYKKYADEKLKQLKSRFEKFGIAFPKGLQEKLELYIGKGQFGKITEEIEKLEETVFEKDKEERKKGERAAKETAESLADKLKFEQIGSRRVLVAEVSGGAKELQEISRKLSADDTVIMLFSITDKINVFGSAGAKTGVNIGKIVSQACAELGGKGGGSPLLAQGIGTMKEKLKEVMGKTKKMIE
ncbi:MAG: alanine--tRNA ligase [Candidatus Aenigmatarchaeota archaeon]